MIEQLLKALQDGNVDIEVIEVPAGKTIEQVIREREEPMGDSASCSDEDEHSERLRKERQAKPLDALRELAQQKDREDARQSAINALRKAQAEILQRYDMLKQLEKSIATPDSERTPKHTIDEILLSLKLGMEP